MKIDDAVKLYFDLHASGMVIAALEVGAGDAGTSLIATECLRLIEEAVNRAVQIEREAIIAEIDNQRQCYSPFIGAPAWQLASGVIAAIRARGEGGDDDRQE